MFNHYGFQRVERRVGKLSPAEIARIESAAGSVDRIALKARLMRRYGLRCIVQLGAVDTFGASPCPRTGRSRRVWPDVSIGKPYKPSMVNVDC